MRPGLQLPLFKPSLSGSWKAPDCFPDLSKFGVVGLDTETYDPGLLQRGPGGIRRDGHLAGISVALHDGLCSESFYYPIGHQGGGNLDKEVVLDWLRNELKNPKLKVVGANIQYDMEWLESEGVEIKGSVVDVQVVEALIEEEATKGMSLEALSQKYLGVGKEEGLLKEAAEAYGVHPKSGLWQLPAKYVGPYAEWDAMSALKIWRKQMKEIEAQDLKEVYELETSLTPILWRMRKQGVPIDVDAADRASKDLHEKEKLLMRQSKDTIGREIDPWSSIDISKACDKLGIEYPRTAKGCPSFTKEFLGNHNHDWIGLLSEIREVNRLRCVFIDQLVSKFNIKGRIHTQWKQLASDDGGTRTGRLASADPNMQQIPSRSEMAPVVRAMFIPPSAQLWNKADYSQQEPRILVHYAALMQLTGAVLAKMAYCDNAKMDIYQFIADAAKISRRHAKGATLGRMYGMGPVKFAKQQGLPEDHARQILSDFDTRVPFVKEISDKCANLAQTRGWIRTLSGRRRHFNLWEPTYREEAGIIVRPLPLEEAREKWPGKSLRRFGTQKALNALIQGSAADMTKRALVAIHREMDIVPMLQVHDELDYAIDTPHQAKKIQHLMETTTKLLVPIIAEPELLHHWK